MSPSLSNAFSPFQSSTLDKYTYPSPHSYFQKTLIFPQKTQLFSKINPLPTFISLVNTTLVVIFSIKIPPVPINYHCTHLLQPVPEMTEKQTRKFADYTFAIHVPNFITSLFQARKPNVALYTPNQ